MPTGQVDELMIFGTSRDHGKLDTFPAVAGPKSRASARGSWGPPQPDALVPDAEACDDPAG